MFASIKQSISRTYLDLCARLPFLSRLYYLVFSKDFAREQHSVLMGRRLFLSSKKREDQQIYTLRRNIHRLEKALIMKPRRAVFAEDYIRETVLALHVITQNINADTHIPDEFFWFKDVLEKYFAVVQSTDTNLEAKRHFEQSLTKLTESKQNKSPYLRDFSKAPNISISEFQSLCVHRRSVRWFEDRTVEREKIDLAIQAASLSPSACNRQPYEYRIYDKPDLIQELASIPMGTKGFHHNFPCIAIVIGRLDAFPFERDRHLIYIDGALSAMTFVYALETQGLSSCMINWPDIESKEQLLASKLNLQPYERPIMFIAFGYPDKNEPVPFSHKRELSTIRSFNKL